MRVGIIVDGQGEIEYCREIVAKLGIASLVMLKPWYENIQPKSTVGQIAKRTFKGIEFFTRRNVDLVIVLLDLEDLMKCAGTHASEIESAIARRGYNGVRVVVKNRTLENWLIADPQGLGTFSRFSISNGFRKRVAPNSADNVGKAEDLLKSASMGREYSKRQDPARIAKVVDPVRVGANSRSFRRFLRVLGHPGYALQSRLP